LITGTLTYANEAPSTDKAKCSIHPHEKEKWLLEGLPNSYSTSKKSQTEQSKGPDDSIIKPAKSCKRLAGLKRVQIHQREERYQVVPEHETTDMM
jgi:hypothetical protein